MVIDLKNLKPPQGAKKKKKRVGRGGGSGWGRTAARGQKGQNSRSGGGVRLGFEGGQTPLYRRIPKKKGFKNYLFKKKFNVVNVGLLEKIFSAGDTINLENLAKTKKIKKDFPLKVLGDGELKKTFTVKAAAFSEEAKKKITAAGGKIQIVEREN